MTTSLPRPQDLRWVINLSTLFTELPLLERPAAAAAAGYQEVEAWWPFGASGRPPRAEIDALVAAIENAGVTLYAMNLFAGDMPAGERGVLSYPERIGEFRDSVAVAVEVGRRLGTRFFNAPVGHRRDGLDHDEQDRLTEESLAFAAGELAQVGGTVLLEPVSGMPRYQMKLTADALDIVDRVRDRFDRENLGFLLDQYHLAENGADVLADIDAFTARIVHVQLADTPGRHEPGSAAGRIEEVVRRLLENGYTGALALEYFPSENTAQSLEAWNRERDAWWR